jgi:hypothetical protein
MDARPVTVGDLFRPEDEIGQWVFALSAATEDLALAESAFRRELDADAEPQVVGYYYRHLVARIYEAERPILALDQHPKARAFAGSLSDAQDALSFLRSAYIATSGGRSRVRDTFGDVRHLSVHHSWVGSDELREALRLGADEEARIIVNRGNETLRHEWPEAVVGRYLLGDLTDDARREELRAEGRFAQEILQSFARLLMRGLNAYLARVGIDGRQLVREVG